MIFVFLLLWIGLSYVVAKLAEDRVIGFTGTFVISLITSPIIGLIVIAFSPINEHYSQQVTDNKQDVINSIKANQLADEIIKLKKMKDDGLITEIEFEMLKYKLLNDQ